MVIKHPDSRKNAETEIYNIGSMNNLKLYILEL